MTIQTQMNDVEMNLDIDVDFHKQQRNLTLMKKLPQMLRILGAGAVLIAMYSFLMKGWQGGNDMLRYAMLLGHTGAMAGIGLASGYWLKEGKGARLLLTLALVSVPANFAILGAFIYSQTAIVELAFYPQYVAWAAESLSTALWVTGAALIILLPVIWIGFLTLARSISKRLALLFVLSNLALLIPLRDPQLIGFLVTALIAFIMFFSANTAKRHVSANTQEGMLALALQYLPLAVLLGRSLWLYSTDLFLLTVMSAVVFVGVRQLSLLLISNSSLRGWLELFSTVPALVVGAGLYATLSDAQALPVFLILPLSALASALLIYDISLRSKGARSYRMLAIVILASGLFVNIYFIGGVMTALMSMLLGGATSAYGYHRKQIAVFVGGIVMVGVGVINQLYYLFQQFDLGSWATLAIAGITAIVVGSLIESKGGRIKPMLTAWKAKYGDWEN
jgi:hypothetical protein